MFPKYAPMALSSFQHTSSLIFMLLLMLLVSVSFSWSLRNLARASLFSLCCSEECNHGSPAPKSRMPKSTRGWRTYSQSHSWSSRPCSGKVDLQKPYSIQPPNSKGPRQMQEQMLPVCPPSFYSPDRGHWSLLALTPVVGKPQQSYQWGAV